MESPPVPAKPSAPAARPAVDVEKVREEIQEAAVQYSDTELPKFEVWLKSTDPAIRAAAVDGLLQSGLSGGAILLRDAAAASRDPQEIQTLTEGAAILEAPPATARLVESLKNQPDRQPARHFHTGGTAPVPAGQ
ncbi:MAG: hypothetical protein JWO82_3928 [Akkermansiaceae bacterium]|nr:hypothetical protein [Akkermansiaceae bacterium]